MNCKDKDFSPTNPTKLHHPHCVRVAITLPSPRGRSSEDAGRCVSFGAVISVSKTVSSAPRVWRQLHASWEENAIAFVLKRPIRTYLPSDVLVACEVLTPHQIRVIALHSRVLKSAIA